MTDTAPFRMTDAGPEPAVADDALRVLMWMPSAHRIPGGHKVKFEMTARSLRQLGLSVTETTDPDPSLDGYDLVHGFWIDAAQVRRARGLGIPVVISTVYWGNDYRVPKSPAAYLRSVPKSLYRGGRLALAAMKGQGEVARVCWREAAYEVDTAMAYAAADLLMPDAEGEGRALQRDLGVATPYRFVPNGVDPDLFGPGDTPSGQRDRVLCQGRIEPHKGQLGLIEALRGTGLRLTIAGYPHPDHADYVQRCRRAGAGWVEFAEPVPYDQLPAMYHSARVHALASWYETTGLVSLEAALCGCNVVSTSRGHAAEYLGDDAWYCDPADPASIRDAVLAAWSAPERPALRQRILERYTWRRVAEETLAGYRSVLAHRPA